jgi:hypothetical protein
VQSLEVVGVTARDTQDVSIADQEDRVEDPGVRQACDATLQTVMFGEGGQCLL